MARTAPSQFEMMIELGSLITRSVQANTRLLMNGQQLVQNASKSDGDIAEVIRDSAIDAAKICSEFLTTNIETAFRFVQLGVNYSSSLLERSAENTQEVSRPRIISPPVSETPRQLEAPVDLVFTGTAGSTCSAGITIENSNDQTIDGALHVGRFRGADGLGRISTSMILQPPTFTLQPSEKLRIAADVNVPEDAQPGRYHADVMLDGFPEIRLRFVLEVVEGEDSGSNPEPTSGSNSEPTGV